MKVTDYAPRSAPFDTYLRYKHGAVGAEVGVDVGAHAEALLSYTPVQHVTLIDPWPNPYARGYCEGRLSTHRHFRARFTMVQAKSAQGASNFEPDTLDFVYLDQDQAYETVAEDLRLWWPRLRREGVLGQRNYAASNAGLMRAVDEWVAAHARQLEFRHEPVGEAILIRR